MAATKGVLIYRDEYPLVVEAINLVLAEYGDGIPAHRVKRLKHMRDFMLGKRSAEGADGWEVRSPYSGGAQPQPERRDRITRHAAKRHQEGAHADVIADELLVSTQRVYTAIRDARSCGLLDCVTVPGLGCDRHEVTEFHHTDWRGRQS